MCVLVCVHVRVRAALGFYKQAEAVHRRKPCRLLVDLHKWLLKMIVDVEEQPHLYPLTEVTWSEVMREIMLKVNEQDVDHAVGETDLHALVFLLERRAQTHTHVHPLPHSYTGLVGFGRWLVGVGRGWYAPVGLG